MRLLQALLQRHLDRLRSKRTAWTGSIEKLLDAVVHCRAGKPLITGEQALGVSWGALAESGNVKLPFYAYSELPIMTCPGAGVCISWCYSLKAWRYPDAFIRQALNTLAARYDQDMNLDPAKRQWPIYIARQVYTKSAKKRKQAPVFLRLFVDGDFYSDDTLLSWMEAIKTIRSRGDQHGVEVYGYSKAWTLFLALENARYEWPTNYVVNASSGTKHASKLPQFSKIPIVIQPKANAVT